MANVREEDERRSIDRSGAKVSDRSVKAGSFLEQTREEPKSFDKWGDSPTSCLRDPLFDAFNLVTDFCRGSGSTILIRSPALRSLQIPR